MPFTVRPVREEKESSQRTRKWFVLIASIVESAVHLGLKIRKRNQEEKTQELRERALKRVVTILVSILFALLLLVGTLKVLMKLKAISFSGVLSSVAAEIPRDEHGFVNILLLGAGDNDHEGVDLTDTMMIASVDPSATRSVVLLSLPRDLYFLDAGPMGKGRINSLYRDYKSALIAKGQEKGAASAASLQELTKQIGSAVGLELQGAIKINFTGFEQAVDAIGGVDVFVPEDLVDPEYPGPNYSYRTFAISKGPHHLSGALALQYVRTRHSTSDFSRSARQQQVIAAAAAKVKAGGLLANLSRANDLLGIMAKNMETTFSARQLLAFADIGKRIDQKNIVTMQLSDQNGLFGSGIEQGGFLYAPPREEFGGAAVLLPVSIPAIPVTWKQIQSLGKLLFLERTLFLRPASIEVLNAGAKEGSARKIGGELYRYGLRVTDTRNFARTKNPSFDTSFVAVNPALRTAPDAKDKLAQAERTAKRLEELLHVKADSSPEVTAFGDAAPDIIIVLGKDYSFSPLQDLIK